jgi:hypothetical protein
MAFCFEQWEIFDALIESVLGYLRVIILMLYDIVGQ